MSKQITYSVSDFFRYIQTVFPEVWCIQRDPAYPTSIILHVKDGPKQYVPLQVSIVWPPGASYWDGTLDSFCLVREKKVAKWMLNSICLIDGKKQSCITGIAPSNRIFVEESENWYPVSRIVWVHGQAPFNEYKNEIEKRCKERITSQKSNSGEAAEEESATQEDWRERMERNYPLPEGERLQVLCEQKVAEGSSDTAQEAV